VWLVLALSVGAGGLHAGRVSTRDGLSGEAEGAGLTGLALDEGALEGVTVEVELLDPRTEEGAGAGFSVSGTWTADGDRLVLDGAVQAEGAEDRVADLVVRVRGARIALGSMPEQPLLLPRRLLSRLPLVSLRVKGEDRLALAVPPDKLAVFAFRQRGEAAELRFRFGFTTTAKRRLKMRAPFTCILYRAEPRWHFRSALERYYEFFPEPFTPFVREQGGWFFAAPVADLPNPQHFHYHEGGPACWRQDDERGLGTYPYRESSSATVSLAGDQLPKDHEEAMRRFAELAEVKVTEGWTPARSFRVDPEVKRSGQRSLLADGGETGAWAGGRQCVFLDPPSAAPIVVRGFSRADGVTGARDSNYSIFVDVCYAGGGYLFGQCATFAAGTHDWEEAQYVIKPAEPVRELRVYCLLRGRRGRAWFDDVRVGPAADPETNWLVNPGFEKEKTRDDLQYIRDNVCYDAQDRYVFFITDNVGADVKPTKPLNLLRFSLNVDPDVPDTEQRPAVAARQFRYYDGVFERDPSVDGCYIDSVSGWCSRVLNTRREHWPCNDAPFTYDLKTFRVAAHGRFAMFDYLRALQERYHPLGKAVFTNIHTDQASFPLYLVSDVPGIESSLYAQEYALFFHRACSYRKPLLLLNFMNIQGLDKRDMAELYHLNAAQWGEYPSTGRFVQRAYREYGDVTHAYVPAIKEISAAGWAPVPLASGARVERFAGADAVTFTVRAPQNGVAETLAIEPAAVAGLGDDLVAVDAVWLAELPVEARDGARLIRFTHGAGLLHVVRVVHKGKISGRE